ncbi:PREDICTED: prostaglandin E synthase 2 [Papilio polytes]|uniref:prostaglandin E synthase 2 n=1 Tax=Papilio polytes TaxID=76194 RepID=UPI000675DBAA|nr:PREDICTED: prostaglandin E synthase 2 [Papilio polytes]XP_013137905.1 PREDICTED: prostaglandin E synthase 2 [Papilio polytes]
MWRPIFTIFRKVVLPSIKDNVKFSKTFYSTKNRFPKSTAKLTLVSASVGVLIGAGYGGYTHYVVNSKKRPKLTLNEEYAFLNEAPPYRAHYKVINESDSSNLQLILFQYRTCPFCCKIRSYLDSKGISYEIVEVDAVLRQAIKWSAYKKVPIVLAKVDGGYQQLMDSTAIISALETYFRDRTTQLTEVIKFYPITRYTNDDGKSTTDITNKYFVMHNSSVPDQKERVEEKEEREWRQWADSVLVHTLSPNVYRTPGEALETFKWFEEVGGWKQSFPSWECALMVYGGAAAMWMIAKRLKKRHNLEGDVRHSLYNAADAWTNAVKKKGSKFLGGDQPNLADVSVYGVLSSIEGCQAFQDLRNNTDIGKWYDDMRDNISSKKGRVLALHTMN